MRRRQLCHGFTHKNGTTIVPNTAHTLLHHFGWSCYWARYIRSGPTSTTTRLVSFASSLSLPSSPTQLSSTLHLCPFQLLLLLLTLPATYLLTKGRLYPSIHPREPGTGYTHHPNIRRNSIQLGHEESNVIKEWSTVSRSPG